MRALGWVGVVFLMACEAAAPLPPGAASRPAFKPKLMANHFDPVAYVEGQSATKGSYRFQRVYDGGLYYFSSQAYLDRFMAAPDRYLPAFNGWCACGMAKGVRMIPSGEHFQVVDGQLYLFHDGAAQAEWQGDPSGMIRKATANWSDLR